MRLPLSGNLPGSTALTNNTGLPGDAVRFGLSINRYVFNTLEAKMPNPK